MEQIVEIVGGDGTPVTADAINEVLARRGADGWTLQYQPQIMAMAGEYGTEVSTTRLLLVFERTKGGFVPA